MIKFGDLDLLYLNLDLQGQEYDFDAISFKISDEFLLCLH